MNAHEKALEAHNRAYDDLIQMRRLHGRDSDEYRQALEDVRAAAKLIRPALRTVERAREVAR